MTVTIGDAVSKKLMPASLAAASVPKEISSFALIDELPPIPQAAKPISLTASWVRPTRLYLMPPCPS